MAFRLRLTAITFAVALAPFLVSCDSGAESPSIPPEEPPPSQTVAELIDENADLETFQVALQATETGAALAGRGPFSVFAPTDDAFDALFEAEGITANDLLASDDLSEILDYHIVAAAISAPDLEDGDRFTTEQGGELEARIDGGIISLIGAQNTVRVIGPPLSASNGVLLVVDDVLLPEGVVLEPKSTTVVGRVVSTLEPTQPIEGAVVSVVEAGKTVETDTNGAFELFFAADSTGQPFTLEVTSEGFEATSRSFEALLGGVVDLSDIVLTPLDVPFAVIDPLMASRATVDFAAGERVTFTAQFNMQVDWRLEIVGQESGAIKRIRGFSSELTEANASWLGGTTTLPLFRSEPVEATLTILNEDTETQHANLNVITPRVYGGEVVTGFEADDNANVVVRNFEFELDFASGLSMEVPAGEGDTFLLLRGTDSASNPATNNFFVGLAELTPSTADGYFDVPTTAPEELYINAFLYNFGSAFTIVVLDIAVDTNGNGSFDPEDATFGSGDIRLEEPGWSPFSRSLADFGLTAEQVQQIVAIRPILISDNVAQTNPRQPVDFGIDYITFTAGGPLEL